MSLYRYACSQVKNNSYFAVGILLGLVLSLQYTGYDEEFMCPSIENEFTGTIEKIQVSTTDGYEPKFLSNKPLQPKKPVKSLQRPRYYSSELGIKDKLFVGVLTTEQNLNQHAVAINKTLAHIADKMKFFITASTAKTNRNLTNIIGFTDSRELLKPFHVFKYLIDNYLNDHDYFYLISDTGFVNGRMLVDLANRISVSEDVYLGTVPEEESHYCSLDAGMLLSNSVLVKVKENLDWCVRNAYSKEHFENIGRCVAYSTNLKCQTSVQNQRLRSFKLPPNWNLYMDLKSFVDKDEFNNAISVYPIQNYTDIYNLQLYFSRLNLENLNREISALKKFVAANSAEGIWPPGVRTDPTLPASQPPDRFHQPRFSTINDSYNLMPDDFTNIKKHSDAEKKDIDYVIEAVISKVKHEYPHLKYHSLVNGYRRFDPSKGMSYIFDMNFIQYASAEGKRTILKRMEVFKPLGKATILPSPYVTESTRIILILPIWVHEINSAYDFMKHFETTFMERKEKIFLLTVLMYPAEASSRGPDDTYGGIKSFALRVSEKYKVDGLKVAWLSIRLPSSSTLFEMPGLMSIAILDLALRKVPLDSLILVGRPHIEMQLDFLNRVKMNTMPEFQIFCPIGFQQYHPTLATGPVPSKGSGRFATWDYSVLSFYSKDYVTVRKSIQDKYPLVRSYKDIDVLIAKSPNDIFSIFEMFVKYSSTIHAFRAPEPQIVLKYNELLFCPSGDAYKNQSIVENDVSSEAFTFGEASLTDTCLNDLAVKNFEPIALGSRSILAKLIIDSGV